MQQKRLQAHITYKTKSGMVVPATTGVLSVLSKPALLEWAYQCGLRHEDYKLIRNSAGDAGTLAHYMIMCLLLDEEPNTAEYSQVEIERAMVSFSKFEQWYSQHEIEPIFLERPFVSEKYCYGGTIDVYARIDGKLSLLDVKTGGGIYDDVLCQLAAYKELMTEFNYPVETTRILHVTSKNDNAFEDRILGSLDKHFLVFVHCLGLYNLKRELNWR